MVRGEADGHSVPDTEAGRLHVELLETRRQLHKQVGFDSLLGAGPAHRRLLEQVRLAADSTVPVLILGEAGTGKRHVARVIHQNGPGRSGPLIPFDAEALPAEMLENELFAARGVTDSPAHDESPARASGRPRSVLAPGSTVLFREILMLPRDVQARLLASPDRSVRLIGTTVLDPDSALASEQIRPDFYFALTALVVRLRRSASAATSCRFWRSTCSSAPISVAVCKRTDSHRKHSQSSQATTGLGTCKSSRV